MSIVLGMNPVTINFQFVLASTIYFTSMAVIQNYAYSWGDWKLMWFANISNVVLWFTYVKAFINVMLSKMGMKTVAFKVTEKVQKQADGAAALPPPPPPAAPALPSTAQQLGMVDRKPSVMDRTKSVVSRVMSVVTGRKPLPGPNGTPAKPTVTVSQAAAANNAAAAGTPSGDKHVTINPMLSASPAKTPTKGSLAATAAYHRSNQVPATPGARPPPAPGSAVVPLTPRKDGISHRDQARANPVADPRVPNAPVGSASYVRGADPLPATEAGAKGGWARFKAVVKSFKPANVRDFDEMFDPLALLCMFLFSAGTCELFMLGWWRRGDGRAREAWGSGTAGRW